MSVVKEKKTKVNEVDLYVGTRLRLRRSLVGLTQDKLAQALGITAQQVQKYENGMNRMGASRLLQVSQILKAPVQYFFEGLEELEVISEPLCTNISFQSHAPSSDTQEILELLDKIKNPQIRHHLLMLIRYLSKTDQVDLRVFQKDGLSNADHGCA